MNKTETLPKRRLLVPGLLILLTALLLLGFSFGSHKTEHSINPYKISPYLYYGDDPSLQIVDNDHYEYAFGPKLVHKKKKADELRIFLVGSHMLKRENNEKPFYEIAGEGLRKHYKGKNIRLIFAGQENFNSTQDIIFFLRWVVDFSPDMVIFITGNDLSLFLEQYATPDKPLVFSEVNNLLIKNKMFNQKKNRMFFWKGVENPSGKDYLKLFFNEKFLPDNPDSNLFSFIEENIVRIFLENHDFAAAFLKSEKIPTIFLSLPSIFEKQSSDEENKLITYYEDEFDRDLINFVTQLRKKTDSEVRKLEVLYGCSSINLRSYFKNKDETLFQSTFELNNSGNAMIGEALKKD